MADAHDIPYTGEIIHASDITNALSSYVTATTLDSIIGEIRDSYFVPKNCKAGDTVILDGIECLCVATGVSIQGSNLTRIAVDKNYDLGYYQKYVGMTQNSVVISKIEAWTWGGKPHPYMEETDPSNGYGLHNTKICLANLENYDGENKESNDGYPWMWQGVNDFRSSHSDKWFVPSIDELEYYVYPYKSSLRFDSTTGGTSNYVYWSSSEESELGEVYYLRFMDGQRGQFGKYLQGAVRLCRAF